MNRVNLCLLSAISFCFIACAGGGSNVKEPTPQTDSEVKQNQKSDAKPTVAKPSVGNSAKWFDPNTPLTLGDGRVKLLKGFIGKVPLEHLGRASQSASELLSFSFEVTNLSDTRKMNYQPWSGKLFQVDRNFATLKDNFGNNYKRIDFGIGSHPTDAIEHNESLYPGKSLNDLLVFEVPIDNAEWLDLELPAKNFGSEGVFRFRISAKSLREGQTRGRGHSSPIEACS